MILTIKSKNKVHKISIDDEDFLKVRSLTWYVNYSKKRIYVYSYMNGDRILMHRFIMGVTDSIVRIKHIDMNGLNNQKSNIAYQNKLYEKEPNISVPACHGIGERCTMPQLNG